jgi:hypothetical protein
MKWMRLYTEARNDAKLRSLTDSQHRVWFDLICFAAEQDDERGRLIGYDRELLAVEVARGDLALLSTTIERLVVLRILSIDGDDITFINFDKRQYDKPSDTPERVTERVRRHRESKRNAHETPGNATDTDTDTDTDTEGENGANALAADAATEPDDSVESRASPKSIPDPPGFAAFWMAYPKGHGSRKASADQWRRLKPDPALRAEIMAGLELWKLSRRWRENFVKDAERWIRDRMWENPPEDDDEIPKTAADWNSGKRRDANGRPVLVI